MGWESRITQPDQQKQTKSGVGAVWYVLVVPNRKDELDVTRSVAEPSDTEIRAIRGRMTLGDERLTG